MTTRLRKTAVIAVDGALAVGTSAIAFMAGAGTSGANTGPTPGWVPQQAPQPTSPAPFGTSTPDLTLSCSSAVFCVGAGDYQNSFGNDQPLVETYIGGSWSATAAPEPSDAATGASEDAFFNSVSCPVDGSCYAAGSYDNSAGRQIAFIDTLAGGKWTTTTAPVPSDAATGSNASSNFKDISCATAGSCTAVGSYDNTSATTVPLFETLSGGTWAPFSVALPAGISSFKDMTSVSCPTATSCAALGLDEPTASHTGSLLYSESNGQWTMVEAPLPSDAGTGSNQGNEVTSLSCAASICEGVGSFVDSSDKDRGILERLSAGVWTPTESPEPSNRGTGTDQFAILGTVSCTADALCTAGGEFEDTSGKDHALVDTLDGNGTPTPLQAPEPSDGAGTFSEVSSVQCVIGNTCTATGIYDATGDTNDVGQILTETNGVWGSISEPLPSNAATGSSKESTTDQVSCSARSACYVFGSYTDTGTHTQRVLLNMVPNEGYWEVAGDGGIFTFGNAAFHGSTGALHLNKPIVGMATTPGDGGYWLVASDGGIFSFGNASFFGSTGSLKLNKPIVGMAATPDGQGYWLVASDGGIFAFGDARFFGSTGAITLNKPIVGMAATPSGMGYWLVASDGGIFAFGDAVFHGSTGAIHLNKPVVGMAATPSGMGYWLVASDGGIFTFGDATYEGSTGNLTLNKPIVGMLPTFDGQGYWELASDGGIFTQGDAAFLGSEGGTVLNSPVVNGAAT